MKKAVFLLPLFVFALLAGCSHTNPIVGTWAGSQTSPSGVVIDNTWTFTADGKNTATLISTNSAYLSRSVTLAGTYSTDGSTLKQTIQTMSEPGRTKTIASPVTATFSYTLNGDTLTLINPQVPTPLVMTRQSSS